MSGKRLLDTVTFLKISRAIAGKHIALRKQQLDTHSRTSSLTKGVKVQADRIALALQAASELARRFDDSRQSTYTNQKSEASTPKQVDVEGKSAAGNRKVEAEKNDQNQAANGADIGQHDQNRWNAKHHEGELPKKQSTEPVDALQSQPDSRTSPNSTRPLYPQDLGVLESKQEENAPSDMKDLFRGPRVARTLSVDNHPTARHGSFKPTNNVKSPTDMSSTAAGRIDKTSIDLSKAASEPFLTEDSVLSSLGSNLANDVSFPLPEVGFHLVSSIERSPPNRMLQAESEAFETEPTRLPYKMAESRVPASRLGRLWEYGGLATSMAFGAVGESIRRTTDRNASRSGSLMFNPVNMERLVAKLSKMRGAALKLGQMVSFQGLCVAAVALCLNHLTNLKIRKCFLHRFKKSFSVSKTGLITCQRSSEIKFSLTISARIGEIYLSPLTRYPWLQHQ
jgi:aarF domain-containing kinase